MLADLRYALRMLAKSPAFTFVAVLTLGLAIGANSAIFSVVNAVLLRPLPYPHSEQLVRVFGKQPQLDLAPNSPANFLEWHDENKVFERIGTYVGQGFNLLGGDQPERVIGARLSADVLPLLGVQPALGRVFTNDEDQEGRAQVVILSHDFWQRRFGGDPNTVGQTITLNDKPYTVVGVMPAGFAFPSTRTQAWVPMAFSAAERKTRDTNYIDVIARLKPGVSVEQARANMDAVARSQAERYPKTNFGVGVTVRSLQEHIVGDVRPMLVVLLGAVAFVLLIACANVANLLLARAASRQREMSIRGALGASRSRVVRLLLTESVLLAIVGGAVGLLLAIWSLDLLVSLKPANLPRLAEIGVNRTVFLFTLGVSVFTGLLFGVVPALQVSRLDLNEGLKESSRGGTDSPRRHRMRALLVVSEVALSLVLLVGAGLMIRSFSRLLAVDPGFKADHVLTAFVALPQSKYPKHEEQTAFFDRLLERLRNLPGVTAAGLVTDIPLYGGSSTGFDVEGRPEAAPGTRAMTDYRLISSDYFAAMGMRLVKGRAFSRHDNETAPGVVIINETLATRFFAGEDPIGRRLDLSGDPKDLREIVGVVGDVRNYGLDAEVKPEVYVPFLQSAPGYLSSVASAPTIVVRSAMEASALGSALREQVQALDKDQPVSEIKTMEWYLADSMAQRRFNMFLLGAFAGIALVLAAVGIYGVIAYTVTQRTHEMGIRIALGAKGGDILRLVFSNAMATTLAGIALGLGAAFALTRLLRSLLYQVSPTDPLIFAAIPLLLLTVSIIATYLPARRAMKVDPITALREP
ncbi:MAG TPA: ABC transporter permease [Chthoniobacterales bacterium]|nr:ABC transporter permease [Chthoniobacterales bacterium]